ncbi:uncharacterized protein TRIVIDRAFT_110896 [Trichoderma virens Gv29-8]|uniref:Secreted protein n=1 Tax=Hypocrea virens (strain Gv29-8 / FGSC 10586) TaxID=413071 RepID=G9MDV4_HYPVG|nr:uncharacterized protein TRIVIDRAFT_110896 [Trichoderma virens Gv29-8]EHK26802.1 hypothetical protein TRIVIDRAFT_110896 [Trichoderma virens Gv29-8]UKZ57256.1 hypothetical protein TrVGV298_011109 [Trichoderma virens]
MKFIGLVALLAPAVLAADFISILQEKCSDMPPNCLEIAKDVHQTGKRPNIVKDMAGLGACNPYYQKCIQRLSASLERRSADAAQENVVTCILQIQPDHFLFMANPAHAKIPFPAGQTCSLRDMHRLAHVVLSEGAR